MQPLWKTVLRFLKKLKIELPYDSASPLLGFNPKELKLDSPRDTFVPIFIAALFTLTNTGKQPKCPLMYQWIDIWYIHIMECCVCVCILSHSVVSDSLWPHGLQHARLPCPSPIPRVYSNSCPSSWWCHPTTSSSVIPFSPAFYLSQHQGLFKWVSSSHQVAKVSGVSASASVLPGLNL